MRRSAGRSDLVVGGADPGQLFVLHNVTNQVSSYDSEQRCHGADAIIEYAVRDH